MTRLTYPDSDYDVARGAGKNAAAPGLILLTFNDAIFLGSKRAELILIPPPIKHSPACFCPLEGKMAALGFILLTHSEFFY